MGDGLFRMPSLGADMDRGTVLEWKVAPGDAVHRGDIVAVVDTEKSDIEVEVFEDGVVEELLVEVGKTVPVGTPLARLAPVEAGVGAGVGAPAVVPAPAAPAPATAAPAPATAAPEPAAVPAPPPVLVTVSSDVTPGPVTRTAIPTPAPAAAGGGVVVRASPRARAAAKARGIDLTTVAGTGPGGAVTITDLAAPPPAASAPAEPAPAPSPILGAPTAVSSGERAQKRGTSMRHAIGVLMATSKRQIPHYYLATTIDMTNALRWLAEHNASRPVAERVLPAVLLLTATAKAAKLHPLLNGFWDADADEFHPSERVHVGVAISLRKDAGLVAPAIHDADQLSPDRLMEALADLVDRTRKGRLRSSEMSDPTITVTNLGDLGVEEVLGVIYPPQVALVGFGRITEKPWAKDGMVGSRMVVRATLSADHRASDGHAGARFLAAIDDLLQRPEDL